MMTKQYDDVVQPEAADTLAAEERRRFLRSLGKWSQAVIGGALLGGALTHAGSAQAWVAARGYGGSAAAGPRGGWVNRYGGGGGGWINGGGGYRYGGGGWINGGGGSAGWVNRYGGGGAGWVNRY